MTDTLETTHAMIDVAGQKGVENLPNSYEITQADLEAALRAQNVDVTPGTVVLIRQFRHAAGGFIYEIPAGKLNPGEDPLSCAARELEEEIGYRASSFALLSSILTATGFADEVIHVYKATGLIPGRQQLDRDEVLEVIEMPLSEAIGKIEDGTIRDGKTIVGLQAIYIKTQRR